MTDLRERFRATDDVGVADVWQEIEKRAASDGEPLRPMPAQPVIRRSARIATVAAALVIGLASIALVLPALRHRTAPGGADRLWAPQDLRGWIAYSSDGNVDVVDPAAADPSRTARLLFRPPSGAMWPLSWSPDGSALLVSWASDDLSDPGGTADLYLIHADGSLTRLTSGAPVPALGSFAPDGTVLFATTDGGISRLHPDSGSVTQVVAPEPTWLAWPAQSVDGTIAFLHMKDGGDVTLETTAEDGSDRRTLVSGLPKAKDVSGLSWSPDGSRVAFGILEQDNSEAVYVVNADGTGLHTVIDGAFPSWSPDGSRLALEKQGALVTLRSDGSDPNGMGVRLGGEGWAARVGPWNAGAP